MQDNKSNIKVISTETLSNNWATLNKVKYEYLLKNGTIQVQEREVYDRGNGAVILLYNKEKQTVVLTRQLRIPTWFNGNTDGMMIEACAGMLDDNNPEECIRIETEEETGYTLTKIKKVMEVYMSPGSVTEILYFFVAAYSDAMKTSEGGGAAHEQENIEVLEIPFKEANEMIAKGEIKDAKTIMLLQYAQIHNLL
ncbi:GDP-mannose pyrophosphatase NudK [Flavobacterium arcticum]|uniref:GDP-mannose pyrophosphatase n=1 Tax=Flavobacterium arcticum TaxID=1784713 RepID=A0A345HDR6_9FLAO|nr:GDP-mannose pyrophosphatase NudK [Flavobacterium arcticum]AXG74726.1 GDP-mannose pyrophosphatase NudK [Flavobacterium arcticum]KAF2509775.1 GDP-mannose pyrophosphatase NudK [Flavobacterium arcticum]